MIKGYDIYTSSLDMNELFDYISKNKIIVYNIQIKNNIRFTSQYQYRKQLSQHEQIHYLYSIGFIGMIFRFFQKDKLIAFVLMCFWLFILSNTIFEIDLYGDSREHKAIIEEIIQIEKLPFIHFNSTKLKLKLKKLNQKLDWYEVIQKGSRLEIHFLPRKVENHEEISSYSLIASKDCIIASFDVLKGNKKVKINQKVNKGDMLVSSIFVNSKNEEKTNEVIGKVFGYTFQRNDLEIKRSKWPLAVDYYVSLFLSRNQIILDEEEYIVKEIPLHFEENLDTIKISIYYVLYEIVSEVGENYE
ncbi:MAG: sporulation protein YqfD [Traorella sp.]